MVQRLAGSTVDKSSRSFRLSKQSLDREIKDMNFLLGFELAKIEMGVNRGIEIAALKLAGRSLELTPRDTGALRASLFIEGISFKANTTKPTGIDPLMIVGYDRNNEAPHAVFVHERLDLRHDPPTQAKFLTTAFNELQPLLIAILKKNAGIKKGGRSPRKGKVR